MKKRIILAILFGCTVFNIVCFAVFSLEGQKGISWPFVDTGPALIQDSYYGGAVALESPFGMIGVVPGGYAPYSGNPLQNPTYLPFSDWMVSQLEIQLLPPIIDTAMLLVAIILLIVPIITIYVVGRKSYGSAKTY